MIMPHYPSCFNQVIYHFLVYWKRKKRYNRDVPTWLLVQCTGIKMNFYFFCLYLKMTDLPLRIAKVNPENNGITFVKDSSNLQENDTIAEVFLNKESYEKRMIEIEKSRY